MTVDALASPDFCDGALRSSRVLSDDRQSDAGAPAVTMTRWVVQKSAAYSAGVSLTRSGVQP
jgi:hypothetical protein